MTETLNVNDVIIHQHIRCPSGWVSFKIVGNRVSFYALDGTLCAVRGIEVITKYSSDPSVWNSDVYAWIGQKDLGNLFGACIISTIKSGFMKHGLTGAIYNALKSTPDQKARALVKCIQESK